MNVNPSDPEVTVSTISERPDLVDALWDLGDLWPPFMLHDPTADLYYDRCTRLFPDLVLVAEDARAPGTVVARGFAVPFAARSTPFPDEGWDAVIRWGIEDVVDGRPTTHASALEITIRLEYRGVGLAARMIEAMRAAAARRGAAALVAPVRPSAKHLDPQVPMDDYADRVRADGLPEDPWLRTHVRAGGRLVGVAPRSMTIVGSLDDWHEWTGVRLDRSGPVEVDRALVPVIVDLDREHAIYVEPNVWVSHPID